MAKEIHQVKEKKKLSQDEAGILILITAFIFGAIFRILPAWIAGFPINDGGMFYSMIQDLRANHYIIPAFTSYNGGNIPFVYPPLGFYLGAALTDLFNLSTPLEILRWAPGILNSLSIPAFYFFAREILKDRHKAQVATLVFALTPHLTSWWSMGGGLTRSLGILFMLFALTYIHRLLTSGDGRYVFPAIVFSGLTLLSHPEAPTYIVAVSILMWLIKSRKFTGIYQGIIICTGVLLLISPWILWVFNIHGVRPFLSVSQVAFSFPLLGIFRIISVKTITQENLLGLIGSIGFLGFLLLVLEKKYLLPGMFFVMALANPRTAHNAMNIPLAMAAAYFIIEAIIPSMKKSVSVFSKNWGVIMALLIPMVFLNLVLTANEFSKIHVKEDSGTATQWIKENTFEDDKFLVITGITNGFCDPVNEWFPTLTERQSITTLQGSEWLRGENFQTFSTATQEIQTCGMECINQYVNDFGIHFDYIYLSRDTSASNCYSTIPIEPNHALILELRAAPSFEQVFESNSAVIYHKK